MLFLKDGDAYVSTQLQVGDRIRVRPAQGRFCLWRPMPHRFIPDRIPIGRVRRATRIWVKTNDQGMTQWLDLPRGKGDALERIAQVLGRDVVHVSTIRWAEEEPAFAVDQRYDFVAYRRAT